MSNELTNIELGRVSARLFQVLKMMQEHDLSITSMQVLLEFYVRTTDMERPNAPTPSEIASSLGMTVSAVSRLMTKLTQPDGPHFLDSDKDMPGSRGEAYTLTQNARAFLASVLSVLTDRPYIDIKAYNLATYAHARWGKGLISPKLRQVNWDEQSLTLTVTPGDAADSQEVKAWADEHMIKAPKLTRGGKNAILEFGTITDAIYFKMRWC